MGPELPGVKPAAALRPVCVRLAHLKRASHTTVPELVWVS